MQQFKREKSQHMGIMTGVCTFLSFKDILTLAKVNKRLYFVTGHVPLLREFTHTHKKEQLVVIPER